MARMTMRADVGTIFRSNPFAAWTQSWSTRSDYAKLDFEETPIPVGDATVAIIARDCLVVQGSSQGQDEWLSYFITKRRNNLIVVRILYNFLTLSLLVSEDH